MQAKSDKNKIIARIQNLADANSKIFRTGSINVGMPYYDKDLHNIWLANMNKIRALQKQL